MNPRLFCLIGAATVALLSRPGTSSGQEAEGGDRSRPAVAEPRPPKPPPPDAPPPADGGPRAYMFSTAQAIAFFEQRVAADPDDADSLARLGECYLVDAQQGGGPDRYEQADAVLRRALEANPLLTKARALLAAALNGQHRFAEALELAREAGRDDPSNLNAIATEGDALLELGRYAEAAVAFERLHEEAPLPEVDARLAHLAERRGRVDEAIALMTRAAEAAGRSPVADHADAWFLGQLGDLLFAAGRLDEAEARYRAVPEGIDAYHDATAGLARVRAARGEIDEAIDLYERAVAIGPDPPMVEGLAELYRLKGRDEEADRLLDELEARLVGKPAERRHLALLYCREGRKLDEALELARLDLESRQDVEAYATYAWALHKNGRHAEAAETIGEALEPGTRDARLHYRAGVIYQEAGDPARARHHLAESLAINPGFSPVDAGDARERLRDLGEGS